VSSGGSALISTLVALGMVMAFARAEPGARDALEARPSVVRRSLAVVPLRVPAQRRPSRTTPRRGRR
jgi:cell division protein FtsW